MYSELKCGCATCDKLGVFFLWKRIVSTENKSMLNFSIAVHFFSPVWSVVVKSYIRVLLKPPFLVAALLILAPRGFLGQCLGCSRVQGAVRFPFRTSRSRKNLSKFLSKSSN